VPIYVATLLQALYLNHSATSPCQVTMVRPGQG